MFMIVVTHGSIPRTLTCPMASVSTFGKQLFVSWRRKVTKLHINAGPVAITDWYRCLQELISDSSKSMSHPMERTLPLINHSKVDHDFIPVYTAFFRA